MKNINIKKLVSLAALSLFMFVISMPMVFAENNKFTDLKECIPEEVLGGKYFYTIIEEPLTPSEPLEEGELETMVKNGVPFIEQTCYRNTLSYSYREVDGWTTPGTTAMLATKCSNQYETSIDPNKKTVFSCEQVQVFLSKGGTSLIEGYIKLIYTWGASLAGLIAVSVLIVSAIQISLAGGDSNALQSAKERIIKSFVGLAVLFLSGLILYTINPNFYTKNSVIESSQEQINK